jgi:hypothetical protein
MNHELTIAELNRLDATGVLENQCPPHDFSVARQVRNSYTYAECARCGMARTEWSNGDVDERVVS